MNASVGRNPLIFVFITRLVDAIGFGIVMPVMPKLLLEMGEPNIAAATRAGGLLLVTYAVLQFLCGPVIGNLSDRFGRRPIILGSLFAYGIDYALMGFAPSVGWLFIGRAVAGIAGAVYVPANAFVADVTPPEKRAHAFGIVSSAFGLGFALGPALGGFISDGLGPRAPFFAAAALALGNLVFGAIVLPESLSPERRRAFSWRRANPLAAFASLRAHRGVLAYAIVVTACLLATAVYPSTWSYFMTARFDWSSGMIGLSLATTGIGMMLVQSLLTGRLSRRIGEAPTAMLGLTMAVAGNVAYALVPYGWMVFPITAIGALQGLAYPALNALMSRRIPPNAQGELQGGLASLASIANAVGPFAMTQTMAYFTAPGTSLHFPGAAFVLAAAINVCALTILLWKRSTRDAVVAPTT